jgi:hypothetical protein
MLYGLFDNLFGTIWTGGTDDCLCWSFIPLINRGVFFFHLILHFLDNFLSISVFAEDSFFSVSFIYLSLLSISGRIYSNGGIAIEKLHEPCLPGLMRSDETISVDLLSSEFTVVPFTSIDS